MKFGLLMTSLAFCVCSVSSPALAQQSPPSPASSSAECERNERGTCGDASDGGFTIITGIESEGSEGSTAGRPVSGSPRPRVITQRTHVPTCTGNTAYNNGVLCTAAVESCPVEGDVQFWVYTRRYDTLLEVELSPWQRVLEPPTVCLGADEASAVDPEVVLPALVQARFRTLLKPGVAEVTPQPDTLINIPTVFTTSTPRTYSVDAGQILPGFNVVITARAEKYVWHFGDDTVRTTTADRGRIEHVYRRAVQREAYVVITWSGSFTVNGGASRTISGTADSTGPPIRVQVRQARSELVRD